MKKEDSFWWKSLCNGLYLVSSNYASVKHIEDGIVEVLDEIEGELDNAIHSESIEFYIENKWISKQVGEELCSFYNYIQKIPKENWNIIDFDKNEDWKIAKKWASSLLIKIKESNRGYNTDGYETIYVEDV